MRTQFAEQYTVKLNHKKPDGYWVVGHEITVCVPVDHGNEKRNHAKAKALARKQFPNCRIIKVTYC